MIIICNPWDINGYILPLHKKQCIVTIIFTNLPSLHPFSFHEMIFILVYNYIYIYIYIYIPGVNEAIMFICIYYEEEAM